MRANWHTDMPEVDKSDPWPAEVEQPGEAFPIVEHEPEHEPVVPPDLNSGVAHFGRLVELVHAEAHSGKTCELKDRDWTHPSCVSCTERGSRGVLCGIGVAQERELALLAA